MSQAPSQKMLSTEEEIELIRQWKETRNEKLLMKLIRAFEPLVLKFVRRFSSYGIDKDELIAVGNLALCEVAERFEPDRNLKFSTFASHWIRGMMLIHIAGNYFSFTMKSQKMKKVFFRLRSLIQKEQKKHGSLANMSEIMAKMAEHFGIEQHHLEQIYQLIRQPNMSFDEPIRIGDDGEAATFGDTIASNEPSPEDLVIQNSADQYHRQLIYSTMDRVLNPRERAILTGQLLVDDTQERTLQDLADEFQLSRERVRQIRNNAYEKLERAIRRQCAHMDPRIFLNISGRKPPVPENENSIIETIAEGVFAPHEPEINASSG